MILTITNNKAGCEVFDIDGKKILKVSLPMELNIFDKKIARAMTKRNELHQAISAILCIKKFYC